MRSIENSMQEDPIECFKFKDSLQIPNFKDFNMVKCTLRLNNSKNRLKLIKFKESKQINDDGFEVTSFKESSKKDFSISEIKSIILGPMQSRLWMFRKAINLISKEAMNNLKFYSWQCLTIHFKESSSIHLVIPKDEDMIGILKLLIYRLKIYNGEEGSAQKILSVMNKYESQNNDYLTASTGRKYMNQKQE